MGFLSITRRACTLLCCAIFCFAAAAAAETCVTQAEMPAATRDMLAARARQLAHFAIAAQPDQLRQASLPDLQRSFAGVEDAIATLKGDQQAMITITSVYLFEATQRSTDAMQGATQFYCGAANAPTHVTLTLSNLPPGRYALVLAQATGTDNPRFLSFVLQDATAPAPATPESWKLGGFIVRPMSFAGHDGIFYWRKARQAVKDHELWNASINFELARQLVMPVLFLSSTNSEKLAEEQQAALPVDWPTPARPLKLDAAGHAVQVDSVNPAYNGTDLWITIDTLAGARPEVVTAPDGTPLEKQTAAPGAPPSGLTVSAGAVAAALVARIPEFKSAFQGIYVHAQNDPVTAAVPMKSL